MGVTNLYPNLPGHLVEFKDGGLQFVTNDTATYAGNSLLILGTAYDGPVNNPVKVDNNTVSTVFGSELDENGRVSKATLVKVAKQAFKNGFTDVRCMRVSGVQASAVAENKQLTGVESVDESIEPIVFNPNLKTVFDTSEIEGYNGPLIASYGTNVTGIKPSLSINGEVVDGSVSETSDNKISISLGSYSNSNIKAGMVATCTYATQTSDASNEEFSLLENGEPVVANGSTKSGVDFTTHQIFVPLTGSTESQISVFDTTKIDNNVKYNISIKYATSADPTEKVLATSDAIVSAYDIDGVQNVYAALSFTEEDWNNIGLQAEIPAEPMVGGEYVFTSYAAGDVPGTDTPYSVGGTVTVAGPTTIDGEDYTQIKVLTNPGYPDFVDRILCVKGNITSASVGDQYTLYDTDGVEQPLFVVITAVNEAYKPATEGVPGVTLTELKAVYDTAVISLNNSFEVYLTDPATDINIVLPTDEESEIGSIESVKFDGSDIDYTFNELTSVITIPSGVVATFTKGKEITVNYKVNVNQYDQYKITFKTTNGGSRYNTAKLEIVSDPDTTGEVIFRLTKAEDRSASTIDSVLEFKSVDFPTVDLLALGMSNDVLNNNEFELIYDDGDIATNTVLPMAQTAFTGGDDGVNITEKQLFEALSGIRDENGYLIEAGSYQLLENYNVDYVYPAGAYADSTYVDPVTGSTFHRELAMLCAVLTYRTKMTHGFIDVKPNSNTSLKGVSDYVNKLVKWSNENLPLCMKDNDGNDIVDADGNKMEIGWYTSIVVGPDVIVTSDKLGTYYGSPAIAYAALNAVISPQSAPTMKALTGCLGMKYEFSNKQQNDLVGARFVVFKTKNNNKSAKTSTPYVVDGCTAGSENCDYARFSTVKVVTDVVDQIREVCEPFLGEPNTIEQRNAMSALISKRLSYLIEGGEILHFEFEVLSTLQQMLLGECQISLTVVPPMELRKITTVVALRAAA